MKPLIYVAGPITIDPFGAVRESLPMFNLLRDQGAIPFMPQWSIIAEMVEHNEYEDWMEYDFDVIKRCNGLVRLKGESRGADREVSLALDLGIPVLMWELDGALPLPVFVEICRQVSGPDPWGRDKGPDAYGTEPLPWDGPDGWDEGRT